MAGEEGVGEGQKASRARGECCIPTGCLKFKRLHANEIDFYEHSMVATLLHTHTHTSTYTYTVSYPVSCVCVCEEKDLWLKPSGALEWHLKRASRRN